MVYGVKEREVMLFNCTPELRAVLLAQEHDSLSSAGAQVVSLFDTVPEEIVHDFVIGVKPSQLFCRVI